MTATLNSRVHLRSFIQQAIDALHRAHDAASASPGELLDALYIGQQVSYANQSIASACKVLETIRNEKPAENEAPESTRKR